MSDAPTTRRKGKLVGKLWGASYDGGLGDRFVDLQKQGHCGSSISNWLVYPPDWIMLALQDLLIARDFSPASDRALRHAMDLAARTGATLHVLYARILHREATEPVEDVSPAEGVDRVREELKQDASVSAEAIETVSVQEEVRQDVYPAPSILNYISDAEVDMITLGTHGRRGPRRLMMGSVAEEVVRRAPCPVLTLRNEDGEGNSISFDPIDRILAPLDFSDNARKALRHAREWAGLHDATLDLLHVIEEKLHPALSIGGMKTIHELEPNVEEKALEMLDACMEDTEGPSVDFESHVVTGKTSSAIAEFVEERDIDLVTLATHGRTGIKRFFLGSVAEKVVRYVPCPVLVVRAFGPSLISDSEEETPPYG